METLAEGRTTAGAVLAHFPANQAQRATQESIIKINTIHSNQRQQKLNKLSNELRNLFNTEIRAAIQKGKSSVYIPRDHEITRAEKQTWFIPLTIFEFLMFLFLCTIMCLLIEFIPLLLYLGEDINHMRPLKICLIFLILPMICVILYLIKNCLRKRRRRRQSNHYEEQLLKIETQVLNEFRTNGYQAKVIIDFMNEDANYYLRWSDLV